MAKGGVQQNLPADVTQLIDQLERHCLAPDGSLVSKSAFFDLQLVPLSIYNPPPPPLFSNFSANSSFDSFLSNQIGQLTLVKIRFDT